MAGRLAEAREQADRALTLARAHGERGNEAYALKLLGEIHGHRDAREGDDAQRLFRQALALASELEMRPLVAHCHAGLGRLYRHAGAEPEAERHLGTAVVMYGEMDMGLWCEQA